MIKGKLEKAADGKYAWFNISVDQDKFNSDVIATVSLHGHNQSMIGIQVKTYCVQLNVPDAIYGVDNLIVVDHDGRIIEVYNPIPRNEV